jgi:hypothetical protein
MIGEVQASGFDMKLIYRFVSSAGLVFLEKSLPRVVLPMRLPAAYSWGWSFEKNLFSGFTAEAVSLR